MPRSPRRRSCSPAPRPRSAASPMRTSAWSTRRCPACCRCINDECVAQAVRTGLGLKAKINLKSRFDRKNYFYPDLPQGYQISQYQQPIVGEGEVDRRCSTAATASPSASSACIWSRTPASRCTTSTPTMSYVDLNRSGVALMEIVSQARHPLVRRGEGLPHQAAHDPALSRHLRRQHGGGLAARRRQRLGAPAGRAARHALRDQEHELDPLHRQAIEYEARRQIAILEDGGTIDQETRLLRSRQGRDAPDALQGRGARLPLFPRPRPAAAGARPGLGRRALPPTCRNCPTRRRRGSSRDLGLTRLRRRRADRRPGDGRLFRGGGAGARRQGSPPTG